jgi:DinB family protein
MRVDAMATTLADRTEAAEYYFTYIDKVPSGQDVRAVIGAQLDEVLELLNGISEEKSLYRYAAGKWSIRESVGHLNDTERLFVFRAMWFARGLPEPLPSFDQDVALAGARFDDRTLKDLVQEFKAIRSATQRFFASMPDDAWAKRGVASGKEFTVRALAYIVAGHTTHHLNLLRERYL